MMRRFTGILGAATLAAAGLSALAPATAQAATIEMHATLRGSGDFIGAHGRAEYESSRTERELEVTASHLNNLAGRYVVVFAGGHKVGKMLVRSSGYVHREWETDRGQYVPRLSAGDPIRVRTTSGDLVLRGRF
jgi:hypothetical protein